MVIFGDNTINTVLRIYLVNPSSIPHRQHVVGVLCGADVVGVGGDELGSLEEMVIAGVDLRIIYRRIER